MQKQLLAVIGVLALCVANATAQKESGDPWVGTWKVDLAKSTFTPGPKPTVPGTITIERSGGSMKTTIHGSDPQGTPVHTETMWMFDGKENPVKGAPAPNTTAAYKRIDDRTFEVAGKVDGKPTVTTRVAISADGKTMTATQSGTNAQGETVKNVIVAQKQ